MPELIIRALGRPAPQGSKKFVGNGRMVESSKHVKAWRSAVVAAALQAMRAEPSTWLALDGPVRLDVIFVLAPPQRMPRGRTHPITYPDLSKVVRATEDALVTAQVIVDDRLICKTVSEKVYATPGQPTGAHIRVSSLSDVIV